jgi:cytochrome c oxidase subunit IV
VDAHSTELVEPASYSDAPHGHGEPGHSDLIYVKVFVVLVVMTAAEVTLSYLDIGKLFIPLLAVLMIAKFWTVVSFFMHLRFEKAKIFGRLFYTGLITATVVYIGALTTFQIWSS